MTLGNFVVTLEVGSIEKEEKEVHWKNTISTRCEPNHIRD